MTCADVKGKVYVTKENKGIQQKLVDKDSPLEILEKWAKEEDLRHPNSLIILLNRPISWGLSGKYFDELCICGVTISRKGGTQSRRFYMNIEDMTLDNEEARNILASKVIESGWISR